MSPVGVGNILCTYVLSLCYDPPMGKKRLIVEIDENDFRTLRDAARHLELSLANYVRKKLALPLEKQGVKRQPEPKATRGRKKAQ